MRFGSKSRYNMEFLNHFKVVKLPEVTKIKFEMRLGRDIEKTVPPGLRRIAQKPSTSWKRCALPFYWKMYEAKRPD